MRAMKLIAELLGRFADGESPSEATTNAYDLILRPFHGYLTFGVFKVALQFVPSRESFLQQMGVTDEAAAATEMRRLKEEFGKVLCKVEGLLDSEGCNFSDRV